MDEEQELWLELYKTISDESNHCSLEVINTYWQNTVIKLTKTYTVNNWATDEHEWETGYIEGVGNNFKEQLQDVINKINNNDWIY
jgi:hypothetical protein